MGSISSAWTSLPNNIFSWAVGQKKICWNHSIDLPERHPSTLPERSAYTFSKIRQMEGFEEIPIIAISASNFEEVEIQSRAVGFNAFLIKPIDQERLLNLVEKYLNLEWIYKS